MKELGGVKLAGLIAYDDEGVPAERVEVIQGWHSERLLDVAHSGERILANRTGTDGGRRA